MNERIYGYARVSTEKQNLDRQIELLRNYGICDRDIITDKASGSTFNREGWQLLVTRLLREGDTLVVTDLDRLGRNKQGLIDTKNFFEQNNINLVVLSIPTTQITFPEGQEWARHMINNLIFEIMFSIAEQQLIMNHEAQKAGMDAARERGVVFGRPKLKVSNEFLLNYPRVLNGSLKAVELMDICGLKKTSYYKLRSLYFPDFDESKPRFYTGFKFDDDFYLCYDSKDSSIEKCSKDDIYQVICKGYAVGGTIIENRHIGEEHTYNGRECIITHVFSLTDIVCKVKDTMNYIRCSYTDFEDSSISN